MHKKTKLKGQVKLLSNDRIKVEAMRLGFSACGLASAEAVDEETANAFCKWIANGCHAEMSYMQNHEEKRLNPCLLMEGAQTVISVALNYYPETQIPEDKYQIAWYAYGKDYHDVMKTKLNALLEFISKDLSSERIASSERVASPESSLSPSTETFNARVFCDTAPVLERYWAWRAGLGWIGKNTQLIIPQAGSCFFLGEIIIDAAADAYDTPQRNRCGTCTRCLNACPTKALEAPFRLNSAKCLSYLTIEYRGELPPDTGKKMGNKIYGCDDCQRACPWNRFAKPSNVEEFRPSPTLLGMQKDDWHCLTEEQYKRLFKGSAVKRAKYQGLMRNIEAAKNS